MGPPTDLQREYKSEKDVSGCDKNETAREDVKEKTMHCASNLEDHSFDIEEPNSNQEKASDDPEDLQIDGLDLTYSGDRGRDGIAECSDATEYSTSFGNTASGAENGYGLSDSEVESPMHDSNPFGGFDGFGRMRYYRKKRLTDHWRRFIGPIMWRCKWVELRIRECQSQVKKYDRELKGYYHMKQCEREKLDIEVSNSRSVCLSLQTGMRKVMKRRKRKQIEATTDVAAYMSKHNLFSFYDSRKCRVELNDNLCVMDEKVKNNKSEIDQIDEAMTFDVDDTDLFLEQVLWKIEMTKSEARVLKRRIEKVLSDFPGKFSSVNRLSGLQHGDVPNSPCSNATCSNEKVSSKNDTPVCTPKNCPLDDTGDLLMPGTGGSNHEEITSFNPKMINGLDEDASAGRAQDKDKDSAQQNETEKDEFQKFEKAINQLTKRPHASMEKPNKSLQVPRSKVPKRKRKRGKRKQGFGGLKRKSGD